MLFGKRITPIILAYDYNRIIGPWLRLPNKSTFVAMTKAPLLQLLLLWNESYDINDTRSPVYIPAVGHVTLSV